MTTTKATPGAAAVALFTALALVAPAAAAGAVPRSFFGVAAWDSLPPSAAKFERLRLGGVGTARIQIFWPEVEYAPGSFDWSRYDAIVQNAADSGVRVLPFLFGTPSWHSSRRENPPLGSQAARTAWKEFVRRVVARYGPGGTLWQQNLLGADLPIHAWEVWNEESSPRFWYRRVNPKGYARLLRMTHDAAREVDPDATLIVGGLFPWPRAEGAVPLSEYLPGLYRQWRVKANFEGIAIHPYTPDWTWTRRVMADVRRIMERNRDAHTGTWITEFGWSSGGGHSAYTRTPAGQADQLRKVYEMLLRHRIGWKLRSVSWFVWGDRQRQEGEPDWWGLHTGLFNAAGGAKPAWSAYADVAGGQP